jgi:hypothetical protein
MGLLFAIIAEVQGGVITEFGNEMQSGVFDNIKSRHMTVK